MGMACRELTADLTKGDMHRDMVPFSSLEHGTEESCTGAQVLVGILTRQSKTGLQFCTKCNHTLLPCQSNKFLETAYFCSNFISALSNTRYIAALSKCLFWGLPAFLILLSSLFIILCNSSFGKCLTGFRLLTVLTFSLVALTQVFKQNKGLYHQNLLKAHLLSLISLRQVYLH